jgi:predicted branched-subunit amino acid permease
LHSVSSDRDHSHEFCAFGSRRHGTGITLGISAWGLVTGVAMVKIGMSQFEALGMTLLVFAGSAQLAALPLIAADAPIWVVLLTATVVNLRFVIFSAQWRPYLIVYPRSFRTRLTYFTADLNYVLFMRRFPEPKPAPEQLPYFWGGVALNWLAWQVPSITGLLLADAVPLHWGIGFAGTLALLGLALSLLTDKATGVAGLVAGCAAVAAYALPFKLNIVVAIAAAVAMGLLIDHGPPRRAPPPDGALDDKT